VKVPIEQDLFLAIADLSDKEQLKIIRAIGYYPKAPPGGWPSSNTWIGIKRILDSRLEMKERIAERNRINGAKNKSKMNDPSMAMTGQTLKDSNYITTLDDNKLQPFDTSVNPFILLTDDPDIILGLDNPKSSLSIFLDCGQGYDDSLDAKEQEFVDRPEVRELCKWHLKINSLTNGITMFNKPELEEWLSYWKEQGLDENTGKDIWQSYEIAHWHDTSGKPIRNWKQKILQVWKKQESHNQKANRFGGRNREKGVPL